MLTEQDKQDYVREEMDWEVEQERKDMRRDVEESLESAIGDHNSIMEVINSSLRCQQ
jgi:hypothetical protein